MAPRSGCRFPMGLHARAVERGLEVVYPLTDEPWGVRRFFVVDPNGTILNIMSHQHAETN